MQLPKYPEWEGLPQAELERRLESSPPRVTPALAVKSMARLDRELFDVVSSARIDKQYLDKPKLLKKAMPELIEKVRDIVARGGRPDVRLTGKGIRSEMDVAMALTITHDCEPLLKPMLAASPPANPNVSIARSTASTSPGGAFTCLWLALVRDCPTAVSDLIGSGRLDVRSPMSYTNDGEVLYPLHYLNPRSSSALQYVDMLVGAGADIEAVSEPDGLTPLLCVLKQGTRTVSEAGKGEALDVGAVALRLIHHGANIHARCRSTAERPLDLAVHLGLIDVVKALLSKGADPTPVHVIHSKQAGRGQPDDDGHGNLNFGSHYLESILINDHPDMLKVISDAGVDLGRVMTLIPGKLPYLTGAIRMRSFKCVKWMIQHADVCQIDVNMCLHAKIYGPHVEKITALDAALEDKSCKDIVALLKAAGGRTFAELSAANQLPQRNNSAPKLGTVATQQPATTPSRQPAAAAAVACTSSSTAGGARPDGGMFNQTGLPPMLPWPGMPGWKHENRCRKRTTDDGARGTKPQQQPATQ